ncbi:MAG: tryptophan 7-halogenase [Planctomycetes bacterium]|nr:tryptophan 7-halogenase [Planctomycetota bacterium]
MPNERETPSKSFDVVICGGGLSGLLLARQLRRELPDLSVAVIERQGRPLPDGCHKVGESSVEAGCQYMESLGLAQYMLDRQLVKYGLRFFPGGGKQPVHERTEIGPCAEPVVKSYQIDRGRFENDLREFNEADGVAMIEGCKVTTIELGEDGALHRIDYEGAATGSVTARWLVDATGRQALLRKRMKSTRGSPHAASAGWFRIEGRLGPADLVPATETEWHGREGAEHRWRSTNHFMGPGYWLWLIPLSTGMTSVGLVIHKEIHDPKNIAGLENTLAFIREHEPYIAAALERFEVKDFLCLHDYSHQVARAWSPNRWAMVGEAGAFVDPLYSPGSDYIGFANMFTTELIRRDFAGEEWVEQSTHLNYLYRAMVSGAIDIFKQAAPVYGHPSAMLAKIYWDNLSYWSFTCHLGKQGIHTLSPVEYQPYGEIGTRLAEIGNFMQAWLRHWALLAPEPQDGKAYGAPHFPSVHIDAHMRIADRMTLPETLDYMRMRHRQIEEAAVEIVLRTLQKVGPEIGRQLLEATEFGRWNVQLTQERIETELLRGQARRLRMSIIARDAERSLGKIARHERADEALDLLQSYLAEPSPAP